MGSWHWQKVLCSLSMSQLGSITSRCSGKWAHTHPPKESLFGEDQRPDPGDGGNRAYVTVLYFSIKSRRRDLIRITSKTRYIWNQEVGARSRLLNNGKSSIWPPLSNKPPPSNGSSPPPFQGKKVDKLPLSFKPPFPPHSSNYSSLISSCGLIRDGLFTKNLFVISRARYFENLQLKNFRKTTKMFVILK